MGKHNPFIVFRDASLTIHRTEMAGTLEEPVLLQKPGRDYFPFFELPAELRVTIYEMLLVQSKPIALASYTDESYEEEATRAELKARLDGARLLRTSRQVRAEALCTFYARNDFVVCIYYPRFSLGWLRSIGSRSRTLMENVLVHEWDWRDEIDCIKKSYCPERVLRGSLLSGTEELAKRCIDGKEYRVLPLASIDCDAKAQVML